MNEAEIRELLTSLQFEGSDMVLDAIVIARVDNVEEGSSGIAIGGTEGLSWVTQLGLIRAAELALGGHG